MGIFVRHYVPKCTVYSVPKLFKVDLYEKLKLYFFNRFNAIPTICNVLQHTSAAIVYMRGEESPPSNALINPATTL